MNAQTLLDLIAKTPTAFHAAQNVCEILTKRGFRPLPAQGSVGAGDYYAVRNGSAVIALRIPEGFDPTVGGLRISAAHGDSPAFKLKPNGNLSGGRLDAEPYGGMIRSSWLDRPLSIAGRVLVRTENGIESRLICSEPAAVMPNCPPHLTDRKEHDPDPKSDLVPLFGGKDADVKTLIASLAGTEPDNVVGHDLFLVNCQPGVIFGAEKEYIASPRLDDLECAYTCLDGFLAAEIPTDTVAVYALFDNEETGSLSYAGAAGTLLKDVFARMIPQEDLRQAVLARSFFVSADNAHALHPNHPELFDAANAPVMNGGPVVKYNASQRYVSDGFSGAVFAEICRRAGIPVQVFANRSDLRGGSTLGNLSEAQVPLRGVDIGAAQLAMHSILETAGAKDAEYLSGALKAFYSADFTLNDNGAVWH